MADRYAAFRIATASAEDGADFLAWLDAQGLGTALDAWLAERPRVIAEANLAVATHAVLDAGGDVDAVVSDAKAARVEVVDLGAAQIGVKE